MIDIIFWVMIDIILFTILSIIIFLEPLEKIRRCKR